MIDTITLRNFKSFGERQVVPLQPITVLVGPNNSGKSNFMSLGRIVSSSIKNSNWLAKEGGLDFFFHRPPVDDEIMEVAWKTRIASYLGRFQKFNNTEIFVKEENFHHQHDEDFILFSTLDPVSKKPIYLNEVNYDALPARPFIGLQEIENRQLNHFIQVCRPMVESVSIQLSLDGLREDAEVLPEEELRISENGSGLASVLGLWQGLYPDRVEYLEQFIQKCVPEIKRILVSPAPRNGFQRIWIEQQDGQKFDAHHISDGVLSFIGLAMIAIEAPPEALIFIEEPEQSIHPQRIHDLVELMREIVDEKKCQFIIATHSRVLIDNFKDEPEAILRFRRGEQGTVVQPISMLPKVVEALHRSSPGELVETGLFGELDATAADNSEP